MNKTIQNPGGHINQKTEDKPLWILFEDSHCDFDSQCIFQTDNMLQEKFV